MAEQSLKDKTVKGVAWNAVENFANKGIQLFFSIILARILSPEDYGIIGLILVFISVSSCFVSSGFGMALIRKIDRTEEDYATVFYFNIVVSLIVYLILYVTAPLIASFYEMPILKPITRVLGVSVILGALTLVQETVLNIKLDFKSSAKVTVSSNLISGIIGVWLAYRGYGVWTIVIQMLASSTIRMFLLWMLAKWRPRASFSTRSFKELFGFGSKILISSLIDAIYNNLYPMIIGKLFSATALGYYSKANNFASAPSFMFTSIFQRVTFPVLSQMQEDNERLSNNYIRIMRMMAFVVFPIMMLLFAVADPMVRWLVTDKWAPCIVLLQILCVSQMWIPIHAINLNILRVKGRSDLLLYLEIAKKIVGIIVIAISYKWGVEGMCYGAIASSIICLVINTYYTGRFLDCGFWGQMKEIMPFLLTSVVSGILTLLIVNIIDFTNLIKLIIGFVVFIALYGGISYLFKFGELKEVISMIPFKKNNHESNR